MGKAQPCLRALTSPPAHIFTMFDGDLQNDPTDIPMMLEKLKAEDWDVVAGNRKKRQDGAVLRKIPSKIANAIIRSMTKVYIQDYGCTLKSFQKGKLLKSLVYMESCIDLFLCLQACRAPELRR